ncbi:unnamed protein product [Larinioides sclopetarius]|uniref:Uncharacterized protein n=1 Tax=Larinioides sclopetarius TaxID=280406 RepID=A0AAV1ZC38_9ARAC
MTKKKKTNKYIKNVSTANKARSLIKNLKKARRGESKNHSDNQARNSNLLESAADVNKLYKTIIEEFSKNIFLVWKT